MVWPPTELAKAVHTDLSRQPAKPVFECPHHAADAVVQHSLREEIRTFRQKDLSNTSEPGNHLKYTIFPPRNGPQRCNGQISTGENTVAIVAGHRIQKGFYI